MVLRPSQVLSTSPVQAQAYPAGEGGVGLPLFREVLLEVEG
ncbi:hypothetical protein [Thermus scotoductus]|nr:hypothetical protein [Thermus scotoductus]